MSRYNTIVPVALGEIRRIEGTLGAALRPGTLVTITENAPTQAFNLEAGQGAVLAANATANTGLVNVGILMENEDEVAISGITGYTGYAIDQNMASGAWGRAHIMKPGEEVTVVLDAGAAIAVGDKLGVSATVAGRVAETATLANEKFVALETATAGATGDALRILARVL